MLDIRRQKDAIIPEGPQKIEGTWFQYSQVESVTIPKSVKEI